MQKLAIALPRAWVLGMQGIPTLHLAMCPAGSKAAHLGTQQPLVCPSTQGYSCLFPCQPSWVGPLAKAWVVHCPILSRRSPFWCPFGLVQLADCAAIWFPVKTTIVAPLPMGPGGRARIISSAIHLGRLGGSLGGAHLLRFGAAAIAIACPPAQGPAPRGGGRPQKKLAENA